MIARLRRSTGRLLLLATAALVLGPRPLRAQFQGIETATIRLVFTSPLQTYLVPQVTGAFDNALKVHKRLFDYSPDGRIDVLMHDLWHYGNAGARPVPENHVTVGIAPYGHEYESAPAPERMASSMNHELAHIVTTDKATAGDRFFRRAFMGKVTPSAEMPVSMLYAYLTTPRWYSPRWYLEGIATYLETWMNGGLGRALGPYDEMVFRTLVRDSLPIYDVVGLESEGTTVDFQVGTNSYLYGTRFMSYLALRYGNDSLFQWVNRREGSAGYFSTQFQRVYGRSLEEEWGRWLAWERTWQRDNLAAIRRHPTTATRPLTKRVLGGVSRAFHDTATHSVLLAVRYPGQEAQLARIDLRTGQFTRVAPIVAAGGLSVTSLAFDATKRTVFYTTNNSDWRHLKALDLATGQSRMLLRDSRLGDLVFNPADQSLWGVRHDNGLSTLVRVPAPYTEWKQVWTLPYGRDLFDLDLSPDGRTLIGSMSEVSGDTRLVQMQTADLLAGKTESRVLFEFAEWAPSNFVFSADGKFLYGSSYYSGVSNIYRYDLTRRRMQPLSNAETGFFKPLPLTADSLMVFAYSQTGFVPSMIANAVPDSISAIRFLGNEIADKRREVRDWMPPPVSELGPQPTADSARPYRARENFGLNNAYPVVEGYQNAQRVLAVAPGVRFNFADRVGATNLEFTSSYSPDGRLAADERLHLRAVFRHWNWKLTGALNRADFYDLLGPTKVSRKGYAFGAQYGRSLRIDGPTSYGYTVQAATYGNLAILPEFQGVSTSYKQLSTLAGDFSYKSLRKSLGAIEDEVGLTWSTAVRSSLVNGDLYPRATLDIAKGMLLPLNHSSLWFRGSAGTRLAGDRTQPFARFYFGGFANNWVDYRAIKQFRNAESFPGLDINTVSGATYAKAQVEWVSPPLRFRHVGVPSAYLRWANLSLFGTSLTTDFSETAARRSYRSAGAQVDLRVVTLSNLDSTISFGFAMAAGSGIPYRRATMISFKIL
ncbi:MAG: hypothetical protein K2R93_07520 [Gemmatimonadaceae bacterium]|nr:hypothetical protein [Gemmatimonadaceae bacterium]